jgi:hypothetical protein
LADFVHLIFDSSADKCLKICEIIIPAFQKEQLVNVMVKLGSLKSVLNTPHVIQSLKFSRSATDAVNKMTPVK